MIESRPLDKWGNDKVENLCVKLSWEKIFGEKLFGLLGNFKANNFVSESDFTRSLLHEFLRKIQLSYAKEFLRISCLILQLCVVVLLLQTFFFKPSIYISIFK